MTSARVRPAAYIRAAADESDAAGLGGMPAVAFTGSLRRDLVDVTAASRA